LENIHEVDLRPVLPKIAGEYVLMIKDTTLVTALPGLDRLLIIYAATSLGINFCPTASEFAFYVVD